MAHQGMKAPTDCLSVRGGAAGCFRLNEEIVVDVKSFLHMYNYAIKVWLAEPYHCRGGLGRFFTLRP